MTATTARPLKLYLIAGEASGDLLGAHLMRALKPRLPEGSWFFGVGGPKMEAEGMNSLCPFYELSMMGFIEILPYVFNLHTRINATVYDILAKQPDIVITIDSPGFCFRVVERLRKENLASTFVHYVAPTVWAYKPERAEKCATLFDHLLTLLPFEPPYFEKARLACTWVGHPVVAETAIGNGAAFRQRHEIPETSPIFTLLPGSRKGEVERHMPIFGKAVTLLALQHPGMALAVATPKNVLAFVAPFFEGCPFRTVITANEDDKKDAIAASEFAIVKTGTVALEVAMAGTPMIVAYRVNPISAWYLRRHSLLRYYNLINILQEQEVIPELLQEACTPLLIASASSQLLSNPAALDRQKTLARAALAQLTPSGAELPSDRAASVIMQLLQSKLMS